MDNIQPLSRFYGALQLRLTGEAQAPIQSEPGDLHRRLPLGSMAEHFLNDQHNPGRRDTYLQSPARLTTEAVESLTRETTRDIFSPRGTFDTAAQPGTQVTSQSLQDSRHSSFSQLVQSAGHSIVNTFRSISLSMHEDTIQYPELPPLRPMPGTFPETPVKPGSGLIPMEAKLDDTWKSESAEAHSPFHQPHIAVEHQNAMNRVGGAPSTPRRGFERAASPSPSFDIRIRKKNQRSGPPSISTDLDGSFVEVETQSNASTTHQYPPRIHRSHFTPVVKPSKDLATPLEEAKTDAPKARSLRDMSPLALPLPSPSEMGEDMDLFDDDVELDVPTRPVTPTAPISRAEPPGFAVVNPPSLPRHLEDRFPVIVAHAPRHQNLWDKLPVGTLFEIARIASVNSIDLERVHEDRLLKLCSSNKEAMHQVAEALGCQSEATNQESDRRRTEVADELDWEAEQIVQGTGQMLGWQEDQGTRYGGKVQFAASLKLKEPETSAMEKMQQTLNLNEFGQLDLEPPRTRGSCIFTRVQGSHRFLRVRISGPIMRTVSVWSGTNESRKANRRQLRSWAERPIFILGRLYTPLVEKDGVLVYFLEGQDLVGHFFDKGRRGYGIRECQTLSQFLDWWIPLSTNGNQPISKLVSRLHLGLSDTLPGFLIHPNNVEIRQDIMNNGVEFTDGAGLMTPSVALALARKYQGVGGLELPLAYQIRIQTAKGVLLVDHGMLNDRNFSGPHRLILYNTMCKAKRGRRKIRKGPVGGVHILDAADCMICVVKPAPSSSADGARLSSQFITILSGGGVPDEVFVQLQQHSIEKKLKMWTEVTIEGVHGGKVLDLKTRLRLMREIGKSQALALAVKRREVGGSARGLGYGRNADTFEEEEAEESFDEQQHPLKAPGVIQRLESFASAITTSGKVEKSVSPWSHNEISGFPGMKAEALQQALAAGIDVVRSNYWFEAWTNVAKQAMLTILSKFHLTVEGSASGFFQPDPTGILREGEIFFVPKERMTESDTGLIIDRVVGDVIVGRHPALLPTDMRKVKAVFVPSLQQYRGIIFCSVRGSIPLAAICAGGDYDGDEGTIIWEPSIVQSFKNAPLDLRDEPAGFGERFGNENQKVEAVYATIRNLPQPEWTLQVTKHFMASVGEGDTFKIYNSFWNKAVYRDGLHNEMTRTIAHTFNYLMDAKKTGNFIKDQVLAKDKLYWSMYSEPYWWTRQMSQNSDENPRASGNNLKVLTAFGKRGNILDSLVKDGEGQLDHAIEQLKNSLRPTDPTSSLSYNGNGADKDLLRPWLHALDSVSADPLRKSQLLKVEEMVKRCLEQLSYVNQKFARKQMTGSNRSMEIRNICKHFVANPPIETVALLLGPVDYSTQSLRWIKASCAYNIDMHTTPRGGGKTGFPWIVAMRDLCEIKARATSGEDITAIPHAVYERIEVHRYWGA